MTDNRPNLTKTEMRQGDSRKMNSRVLVFGLVALIIVFALAIWFSMATYDDTPTTVGGGTTLDDVPATGEEVGDDLETLPTPVPEEEPEAAAPVEDAAPVETPAAPETPVEPETPAEPATPAAQ